MISYIRIVYSDNSTTTILKYPFPPLKAHDPCTRAARSEGDPEEPAGALQELRRAHHHEDPGGPQGCAQGGKHRGRPAGREGG